jgi:hypothetical protein
MKANGFVYDLACLVGLLVSDWQQRSCVRIRKASEATITFYSYNLLCLSLIIF